MSRVLAFSVGDNIVEKLGVTYGNLNRAGHRAVLSWNYLRTVTLNEIKGIFTKNELAYLIEMRRETKFEPRFAGGSALAYEATENELLHNMGDKYNVDVVDLSKRLNKLTYPHAFFLSDWIDCYWSTNQKDLFKYIGGLL